MKRSETIRTLQKHIETVIEASDQVENREAVEAYIRGVELSIRLMERLTELD